MPGLKPSDLLAQAMAIQSKSPEKAEALRQLAEQRAAGLMKEMERKTAGMPIAAVPAPSSDQTSGGMVGGIQGVGMGLANTVGALGKGVGDTLGNTVYVIGSGLFGTGMGVVGGLAQTGKSALGAGNQRTEEDILGTNVDEVEPEVIQAMKAQMDLSGVQSKPTEDEETQTQPRRRPRKIEIRSGSMEDMKDKPKLCGTTKNDPEEEKREGVKLVHEEPKTLVPEP